MKNPSPQLYIKPFYYDGMFFIYDANMNMVADFGGAGVRFRPRVYGRICHVTNSNREAGNLHDNMQAYLIMLVNGVARRPAACVDALNEKWNAE